MKKAILQTVLRFGITISAVFVITGGFFVAARKQGQTEPSSHISFAVPKDSQVTSIRVWASSLPNSQHIVFTNKRDALLISIVLAWLKNAKVVGLEKTAPRVGYWPGLSIATSGKNLLMINPAVHWEVKKYPQGETEYWGQNVVNEVTICEHTQLIRLDSPPLYSWLVDKAWEREEKVMGVTTIDSLTQF